jgi:hypothetical protein
VRGRAFGFTRVIHSRTGVLRCARIATCTGLLGEWKTVSLCLSGWLGLLTCTTPCTDQRRQKRGMEEVKEKARHSTPVRNRPSVKSSRHDRWSGVMTKARLVGLVGMGGV